MDSHKKISCDVLSSHDVSEVEKQGAFTFALSLTVGKTASNILLFVCSGKEGSWRDSTAHHC